jgi:hypothetical protein
LNKAQNYSLNDQRGKIDSTNLEIPNFLLTNNLLKNQSLSQSLISNQSINLGYSNYSKINDVSAQDKNKSLLLPITSSTSLNSLPIINYQSLSASTSKTINQNYLCSSRSRSPIVIVYDYEDFDGITSTQNNNSIIYEENKNFNILDANNSHSNKFKSSASSINQSYTTNNHNCSTITNNKNNSTRLNDIDELNSQYISSKQPMTSASSLNNSQISYV